MKVSELIAKLEKMPQDANVFVPSLEAVGWNMFIENFDQIDSVRVMNNLGFDGEVALS